MKIYEYDMLVEFNNIKQELKTFASSIEGAIDNMIVMENVNSIYSAICLDTGEQFNFGDDLTDIVSLQKLRKQLPDDIEMSFEIQEGAIH